MGYELATLSHTLPSTTTREMVFVCTTMEVSNLDHKEQDNHTMWCLRGGYMLYSDGRLFSWHQEWFKPKQLTSIPDSTLLEKHDEEYCPVVRVVSNHDWEEMNIHQATNRTV